VVVNLQQNLIKDKDFLLKDIIRIQEKELLKDMLNKLVTLKLACIQSHLDLTTIQKVLEDNLRDLVQMSIMDCLRMYINQ